MAYRIEQEKIINNLKTHSPSSILGLLQVAQVSCELHCVMQDSHDLNDLILIGAVEHDVPGPYHSAFGILRSAEEQVQASQAWRDLLASDAAQPLRLLSKGSKSVLQETLVPTTGTLAKPHFCVP